MKLSRVSEIFDVRYGVNLELSNIKKEKNGIAFVSRTEKNNGLSARVKHMSHIAPNPKNTISVAGGGSVMASFLQKEPYYSGRDLYYLKPKIKLTDIEMLYYCMCLRANRYKYSFGRQANKTLRDLLIPSSDAIPVWVYETKIPKIVKKPIIDKKHDLDIKNWQYFNIVDLFWVKGTKSFTKIEIKEYNTGAFPYVVTSSKNNGTQGFYDHHAEKGGVLTIDSATVGSCFYQKNNFSASDHVEKLIPKFTINTYVALFITTIINQEKYRYGYGRKFAQMRIKNTKIKLPSKEGEPHWEFMENYIKSLDYSAALADQNQNNKKDKI